MNYAIECYDFLVILEGHNDVNWIFDSNEIKFTSGYVFTHDIDVVTYRSTKQTIITKANEIKVYCF